MACTGRGGYAEYALAKLSETLPVPDGVDTATAAAMPTVFLTAWLGLLTDGKLKAGDWVLVQAGSSGVGMAAIQIAKHLGAKVIATSSSDEKCKRLRQLGADEAIDYTKQSLFTEVMGITTPKDRDQYQERLNPDVMEGVNVLRGLGIDPAARRRQFPPYRGVDVALEMIGGDIYQKSLQVLAPGGRLVSLGGAFGAVPTHRLLRRRAQGEPLLHHEPSQGKTRGLPRVGELPEARSGKKVSGDHRLEFSPRRGAGGAAPSRRTPPLRQGRTQDELKEK